MTFYGSSHCGKERALGEFYHYLFTHANKFERPLSANLLTKIQSCLKVLHLFKSTRNGRNEDISNALTEVEILFDVTGGPIGAKFNTLFIGAWKSSLAECKFSETNFLVFYFVLLNCVNMKWSDANLEKNLSKYKLTNLEARIKQPSSVDMSSGLDYEDILHCLQTIGISIMSVVFC